MYDSSSYCTLNGLIERTPQTVQEITIERHLVPTTFLTTLRVELRINVITVTHGDYSSTRRTACDICNMDGCCL